MSVEKVLIVLDGLTQRQDSITQMAVLSFGDYQNSWVWSLNAWFLEPYTYNLKKVMFNR